MRVLKESSSNLEDSVRFQSCQLVSLSRNLTFKSLALQFHGQECYTKEDRGEDNKDRAKGQDKLHGVGVRVGGGVGLHDDDNDEK